MAGKPSKDGVNVQSILRCRPYSRSEQLRADANRNFVLCKEEQKEVVVSQNVGGGKLLERSFHFDKVFGPDSGQERLYNQAIAPIVEEVLEGFNCTIFAYGQTGTGKTYTMEGGDRDSADGSNLSDVAGVIPRAIHHIFTTLDTNDSEYTVKCSFLELYNEETTDLLAVGERMDQKLRIMEDRSGVVIQGLEEFIVKSSTDIYALLDRGSAKRKVAETMLNKQSSRSHGVFCITVHMREIAADGEEVIKIGKLYLVDLAGSENVSRSGAAGTMAKEAGSINKSLLTLGRVITALVEGSGHIPYRDSKLTRLLRDSLGGKTKTCIIATIAPTAHCQDETLSTLDYAHRAKNIRNKPEVNQKISKTAHIKELNAEIDRLKAELFATREKNGIYLPADQFEQREQNSKQSQVKIEVLEADIEALFVKSKLASEEADRQIAALQQELNETVSAYQRAKLGMQERDFLIAAHRRSEAVVVAQSEHLTRQLQSANSAIDDLQTRLTERSRREQANAAVVENLCRESQSTCWGLQQHCAVFSQNVQNHLQLANDAAKTRQTSRLQSAAKFSDDTASMLTHLSTLAQSQAGNTDAICKAINDCFDEVKNRGRDFALSFANDTNRMEKQCKEVFAGIATEESEHQASILACLNHQRQTSANLLAIAEETSAQARNHLESCCTVANDVYSHVQLKLQAQQNDLTVFRSDFAEAMSVEMGKCLGQIEEVLRGFVAKRQGAILNAECLSGVDQRQIVERMIDAKKNMQESLTESSFLAARDVLAKQTDTALQTQQTELAQALTDHQKMEKIRRMQLQASMENSLKHNIAAVESHVQATEVHCDRATELGTSQVQNGANSCISAIQEAQEQCVRLQTAHKLEHTSEMEAANQMASMTLEAASTSQLYSDQTKDTVGAMSTHIQKCTEQDFAQDPDAGVVPERPAVDLPAADWLAAARMPPAEILLAEFRRQREDLNPRDDPALKERRQPTEQVSGVKSEKASPLDARPMELGEENVDPNLEVIQPSKEIGQKSASRNKKRLRQ